MGRRLVVQLGIAVVRWERRAVVDDRGRRVPLTELDAVRVELPVHDLEAVQQLLAGLFTVGSEDLVDPRLRVVGRLVGAQPERPKP